MSSPADNPGSVATADPIAASPVYPAGSRVNERGHLEVAGCDVVELAAQFGTPAYIYSEADIAALSAAEIFELVHEVGFEDAQPLIELTTPAQIQGAFDLANLLGAIAAIVPTFLGVWLGQKARRAASPETFRRIFLVGMFVVGLHMARTLL